MRVKYERCMILKFTNCVDNMVFLECITSIPRYRKAIHRYYMKKGRTNKFYDHCRLLGFDKFDFEIMKFVPCSSYKEKQLILCSEIEKIPIEMRLN